MPAHTHLRRDPERGAALMVALIALVALLGIGGITILSVQSELRSSGRDRFQNVALYAAESGVAAGMEYLRNACHPTNLYSALVEPRNLDPQYPDGIYGNRRKPGEPGNPFLDTLRAWYEVAILNNISDAGFTGGDDADAQVILRVVGHGPDRSVVTLEVEVRNDHCVAEFCASDYAQRGQSAMNSADALCSQAIQGSAGTRTFQP